MQHNNTCGKQYEKNFQLGIFFALFAAAALLIFWKCRYGFPNIDESFYLSIPYRLSTGDALFVDEWHLSQMSGFLLYPFFVIYLKLNGSIEGIILASRYVCAALQCLIGLFIYFRTRKISTWGAAVAALAYTIFIPYNNMALSYNSMGIMALVTTFVILLTAQSRVSLQYFLAGILYASAVLCNPYLAVVFLLYAVFVCIRSGFFKRGYNDKLPLLNPKTLLWLSFGAAALATVFLIFVFSRASFPDFVKAFPSMFSDPEHSGLSFLKKISRFFGRIVVQKDMAVFPVYVVFALLFGICVLDKKRQARQMLYFVLVSILTVCLMLIHFSINYINHLMWSVNALALFVFLLSSNATIKRIFYTFWLPGMLYAFCMHLSSNQMFHAVSAASCVATVGSVLMISVFVEELRIQNIAPQARAFVCIVVAFMFIFQITSEALYRYKHVFWDAEVKSLQYLIEDGIDAGIYVSKEKYDLYYESLSKLSVLDKYKAEKVLYLSPDTWYFLMKDYEIAAYSAWLSGVNQATLQRLEMFYSLNPEKMPDAVYADIEYIQDAKQFCQMFGYNADVYEKSIVLTPIK